MMVRLAVAALINRVFIIVKVNTAAGINTGILFTNGKLPSIHPEPVSKSTYVKSQYIQLRRRTECYREWLVNTDPS